MSDSGRLAEVAGAVLTGGESLRMGSDKARLAVGGVASATRIARCLAALCEDVVLVGGDPPAEAPGRRVPDPPGPRSSLRGLAGALAATRTEHVLVVATDLPFITPDLLLALVAWPAADAVVPRDGERTHPLCALYRREPVLAVARAHLESGRLALGALLDAVQTTYLEGSDLSAVDPERRVLTNLNTRSDLARVQRRRPG